MKEFLNKVLVGNCLDELKKLPDNSVDSVVTDPPYGLSKEPDIVEVLTKWLNDEPYDHGHKGFMGKEWDSFVPHPDIWNEVYRVLKPGGHLLCFAGTRTEDLMSIAIRLAGFERRDEIEWIQFQGFPKSMDIGKQFKKQGKYELAEKFEGYGTQMKPAHEPILMFRKPLEKTVAYNVEKWGTGGLNIDGCRIEYGDGTKPKETTNQNIKGNAYKQDNSQRERDTTYIPSEKGRFPANCITLEDNQFYSKYFNITPAELSKKASKKDRNSNWKGEQISIKNNHPTVKPVSLMEWLIKLITPPEGIVLDPFAGSGSTLVAAKRNGFNYIGVELLEEHAEIAEERLKD